MKLLVSALETSSNLHLKELKKYLNDSIELVGIFDKSLGMPNYDISSLAIMGFVDVVVKLPFFIQLKKEMVKLASSCDKVLLIDGSGFNLPLAKAIKKAYPKKEIIYYILPQAWAWKKKRIPKIEKYCDKLYSIIPFEKEFYSDKNKIQYVGHPLLDEISVFKQNLSNSGKIAFMPGSRKGEITKLMPIFKQVALKLKKESILIIPPHFTKKYIADIYGDISYFNVSNDTHNTLRDVDFAFICSGTATLEASLIGTPFVLSYIAKPLDYFIAKNLVKLKYIGLANIFFDKMNKKPIHKEFIQDDVTVDNLVAEYKILNKEEFLDNSKILRDYLKQGSSKVVANYLNKL
jgi:lipid-A-disaccharide synthase